MINKINYEEMVEMHVSPEELETFLSIFPAGEKVEPRIIFEGIVDGLGVSDQAAREHLGEMSWSMISWERKCLKEYYSILNKTDVNVTINSLHTYSRCIYTGYPRLLITIYGKDICPGFVGKYMFKKMDLIWVLALLPEGAHTGRILRKFFNYVKKYFLSVMDVPGGKPPAVTIIKDGNLEIYSKFNADFVGTLKAEIPYPHRAWNRKKNKWVVGPEYIDDALSIASRYFDVVSI